MSLAIGDLPSPNQDDRPGGIDMLMLHYTGMQSAAAAIERLRDPAPHVSSHYVVDEDGTIVRLVPEERRAFHAGISYWQGRTALNDCSIGIEIVNPGHEWGYRPFPPRQIAVVTELCLAILGRHAIPAHRVVGHSDVAPNRKQDPGELFPWRDLAASGIGLWPASASLLPDTTIAVDLAAVGYDTAPSWGPDPALATTLRAFQRHWRPAKVDGLADPETRAIAQAVARLSAPS